jgi:hypothetical protein
MPAKKEFYLLTVLRDDKDAIVAFDMRNALTRDQLDAHLMTPTGAGHTAERFVFDRPPIPWAPSVRLGEPRKRRAKGEAKAKPDDKKSGEHKPRGTRFDNTTGAKAPEQGETNGA